jgi:WD40-like Beta Propeller Repeat
VRIAQGLRWGITGVATTVALVVGGASPALGSGDANVASCPDATEASPGFGVPLPDCRAYELVSEANSGDAANITGSYGFPEGVHVYYKSFFPTAGAGARNGGPERFLATRTPSGWRQTAISPPQGRGPSNMTLLMLEDAEGVSFTSDFSTAFVKSPFQDPLEEPQLNQTTGMAVYGLSVDSGTATLVSAPDGEELLTQGMIEGQNYRGFAEANDWGLFLAGASADGSRAFFVTTAKLKTAPGAPKDTHEASNEIYERTGGHTYLVGVLPDGRVPACGAEVGQGVPSTLSYAHYSYGAIAPSGANVVFFSPGPDSGIGVTCGGGGLFLRDVVDGTTVELPGTFFGGRAGVGAGGEEEIFTLATSGAIYEYHVGTGQTTEIGAGDLLAYSADGSRVYYVAEGGSSPGIYMYDEGVTKLIPGTEAGNYRVGEAGTGGGLILSNELTVYAQTHNMPVATPDGSHLLFIDSAQLTNYDNEGHHEAYVYDADTNAVTCVSCNPSNPSPSSAGQAQLIDEFSTDIGEQPYQTPSPPFIANDGSRVVFETTEALVPQDTNRIEDVYEWDREGTTGCNTESLHVESLAESPAYSPVDGGCIYLLSSGLGVGVPSNSGIIDGTHLVGASENLNDVYMQTSESLLSGTDSASKLYDVRVDGGFPSVEATYGCEPGQCRAGAGVPAAFEAPASIGFAGSGNLEGTTASKQKPVKLSRRQKLARVLRACRRQRTRRRRAACERAARARYGAKLAGRKRWRSGGSR